MKIPAASYQKRKNIGLNVPLSDLPMSLKSLCVLSGWLPECGYNSDLRQLFSSFSIQQYALFLLTDSTHTIKQFKTQSTKWHLLGFNILH